MRHITIQTAGYQRPQFRAQWWSYYKCTFSWLHKLLVFATWATLGITLLNIHRIGQEDTYVHKWVYFTIKQTQKVTVTKLIRYTQWRQYHWSLPHSHKNVKLRQRNSFAEHNKLKPGWVGAAQELIWARYVGQILPQTPELSITGIGEN